MKLEMWLWIYFVISYVISFINWVTNESTDKQKGSTDNKYFSQQLMWNKRSQIVNTRRLVFFTSEVESQLLFQRFDGWRIKESWKLIYKADSTDNNITHLIRYLTSLLTDSNLS